MNLCIGSLYTWSVFAAPMAERFNQLNGTMLTAADLAIVFTVVNAVNPITMIPGGRMNDRFGPRKVVLLGGILFGGGMFLSGYVTQPYMLVITYGLGLGLGMGLVYVCTITNAVKFFPDKRGLVGGIATATYGMSSVLLPPVANELILNYGVENAFKMIGISFFIVIAVGSRMMRPVPVGYVPVGYVPDKNPSHGINRTWQEMIRDKSFYLMFAIFFCGTFTGLMCIGQAFSMAQNMTGMSVAGATAIVSMLAFFNAFGRIGAGLLSDQIGRVQTFILAFCVSILSMLLLLGPASTETRYFYLAIALVGMSFGTFMGVFPGFTTDQFGDKNNSVNYGIMFTGFALSGITAPLTISRIYLTTESYAAAFRLSVVLGAAGIILCLIFLLRKKGLELTGTIHDGLQEQRSTVLTILHDIVRHEDKSTD